MWSYLLMTYYLSIESLLIVCVAFFFFARPGCSFRFGTRIWHAKPVVSGRSHAAMGRTFSFPRNNHPPFERASSSAPPSSSAYPSWASRTWGGGEQMRSRPVNGMSARREFTNASTAHSRGPVPDRRGGDSAQPSVGRQTRRSTRMCTVWRGLNLGNS